MKKQENYLERKPCRRPDIEWKADDAGLVTLEIENKGVFHRIAQKCFKKPKVSYIHLDQMGSFLWPLMDGSKDIIALGERVEEQFGEEAHPLYERLSKYVQILESYNFIIWR